MIVDEMQFSFMSEKGTIDALFILRKMIGRLSCYGKKKKFCGPRKCFW